MTTYTHSFDTEGTSSVIDEVFYNEDTQELYVQLFRSNWAGGNVVAGYAGVPKDIYDAMELINSSRVNDDNNDASVGAYWNIFVKPNFTGLSTDGLELEPVDDDEAVDAFPNTSGFFTSKAAPVEVEDVKGTEEVSVEPAELFDWTLTFDSDVTEGDFALRAASLEDAIERFEKIAEIAGLTGAFVTAAKVDLY